MGDVRTREKGTGRQGSGRGSTGGRGTGGRTGKDAVHRFMHEDTNRAKPSFARAYSFGLVTVALFVLSWVGQFFTQLATVRNENEDHGQAFQWSDFLAQFFASTFENWQSEFLQLLWQAAGLTFLLYWGSSQSRESDERIEVKIDRLLEERGIDPSEVSGRVNSLM